ncbi:hypothetical protein GCM10018790_80370 [Kitasatospora xanthocidica]|uniref:hypothetical protein n=1 Tax=Kitasatospora xanthocidica TaxID=83382 RepID=UPI00167BA076|nr:hypothetical protein [Kitasatospora xanthocidica]GHF91169.1 hypothetical protein GCM10018790_80370 [Kitasatospora xanthocidica]
MTQVNVRTGDSRNPTILVLGALALIGLVAVSLSALTGPRHGGDGGAAASGPAPSAGKPGPVCAAAQPTPEDPNVTEAACYLRDGDDLYLMASVKAATPAPATVYLWLTAGSVYAYPAGGPYAFPRTTFTSTAQEFRHLVDMPLTRGVTYYVHVSTKPPGAGVPNAIKNPTVTGHSIEVRW